VPQQEKRHKTQIDCDTRIVYRQFMQFNIHVIGNEVKSVKTDFARFIVSSSDRICILHVDHNDFEAAYLRLRDIEDIQFGITWEYQTDEPLLQFIGSKINLVGGDGYIRQLMSVINGIDIRTRINVSIIQRELIKRDLHENAKFNLDFVEVLDRCGLVQNA
jgi:hypothetical protein